MNKNVPKLRFKDDNGLDYPAWEESLLKKYIVDYNETTKVNNQYEVLTSSRKGLFLQKDYFNKQIASEDNTGYTIVPRGYFTYRHMSDDSIFYFNINDLLDYGIVSTLYPVFTTNKDMNSLFLKYYLNESLAFRKYCLLQKQGGSRTYMYLKKLKEFKGEFPCLEEQGRIANFFTVLDKLIEEQEGKVRDLEIYKKGMMQKIFKQEIRFKDDNGLDYPEWEIKKLEDISSVLSGKRVPKGEGLSDDVSGVKYITVSDMGEMYVSRDKIRYITKEIEEKIKKYKVFTGDLIISVAGTLGKINIIDKIFNGANLTENCDKITEFKGVLNKYVYYYLNTSLIQNQINSANTISSQPKLALERIRKFKIKVPCLEEQIKIANFLSNIDNLKEEEQNNLDDLRELKKGLLQRMFV